MTAVRHLLKDLDTLRDTRDIGGFFVGVASGTVVSMAVLMFFAYCDLHLTAESSALLAVPVGLSFLGTTVSTILAIRAQSTAKAVAWTFAGNVLPPTLLCLPTIIGVIYATPAGLFAFAVTLPQVLVARGVRSTDPLGADARERLVGAIALVITTVALLAVNELIGARYEHDYARLELYGDQLRTPLLAMMGPVVTAFAALLLAAVTAVPEVRRAAFADLILRGQMPGMQAREHDGVTEVEAVATMAGGPMRGGTARAPLGAMVVSPARAGLGVVLSVGGGLLLVVAGLAALC